MPLQPFDSVSTLLKAYRKEYRPYHGNVPQRMTQSAMAALIGVSDRTYGSWENEEDRNFEWASLADIARATRIPAGALARLQSRLPTFVNLNVMRYADNPFSRHMLDERVVRNGLFADGTDSDGIAPFTDESLQKLVQAYRRQFDASTSSARRRRGRRPDARTLIPVSALQAAVDRLGAMNWIAVHELRGETFHAGHLLTLPLTADAFGQLRHGLLYEDTITEAHLARDASKIAALHIFSFVANESAVAHRLLRRTVEALHSRSEFPEFPALVEGGCFVSLFAVTEDLAEVGRVLGLRERPENAAHNVAYHKQHQTEIVPVFYEERLDAEGLRWLREYANHPRDEQ